MNMTPNKHIEEKQCIEERNFHEWSISYAEKVNVPERERVSTYAPITQLKMYLVCKFCLETKTLFIKD